jgi:hypothetical protein
MKSKKQVLSERPEYKTLINAVTNRVSMDRVADIINHGIGGGYSGFVYYSETHSFAMRHRKDIISLLEETADCLGQEIVNMVKGFQCLKGIDNEDLKELYRYLGEGKCEVGTITNAMAWFVAEEVCRWFDF